ncbi:MAG: MYG1 family protein [Patescibacteria group bacterium]
MNFFNFLKPKIKIVTHSGNFHADEVFALATLSLWAEKQGKRVEIVRTRDPKIIEQADIVVDVGGEYNFDKGRFDHHQRDGAGKRTNGIPYASFGLVWKHYGREISDPKTFEILDNILATPIDAFDNGVNTTKDLIEGVHSYSVGEELIYALRCDPSGKGFEHFLDMAKLVIRSEISRIQKLDKDEKLVLEEIKKQSEPEILELSEDVVWEEVTQDYKNIKMVVCPELNTGEWCVESPRDDITNFDTTRVLFPENWRGLREKALEEASGIKGAIFCHRAGFFAVAKTRDVAIQMAKAALA